MSAGVLSRGGLYQGGLFVIMKCLRIPNRVVDKEPRNFGTGGIIMSYGRENGPDAIQVLGNW